MTEHLPGDDAMAYVAADPAQPGAAYGVVVDDGLDTKGDAKIIARWVRDGAHVMRVDVSTARTMLSKWIRPGKKTRTGVSS